MPPEASRFPSPPPRRGKLCQPRATPWESEPRTNIALKGRPKSRPGCRTTKALRVLGDWESNWVLGRRENFACRKCAPYWFVGNQCGETRYCMLRIAALAVAGITENLRAESGPRGCKVVCGSRPKCSSFVEVSHGSRIPASASSPYSSPSDPPISLPTVTNFALPFCDRAVPISIA